LAVILGLFGGQGQGNVIPSSSSQQERTQEHAIQVPEQGPAQASPVSDTAKYSGTPESRAAEIELNAWQDLKGQYLEGKRLAEFRAISQAHRVIARLVTKEQFKQKLREIMAYGTIDDMAAVANFNNYSFQDVFGKPDSNIAWRNSNRLFTYRCLDGAIQLTIIVAPDGLTCLSKIDEY
jgi:hypothetical protein